MVATKIINHIQYFTKANRYHTQKFASQNIGSFFNHAYLKLKWLVFVRICSKLQMRYQLPTLIWIQD